MNDSKVSNRHDSYLDEAGCHAICEIVGGTSSIAFALALLTPIFDDIYKPVRYAIMFDNHSYNCIALRTYPEE